MYEKELGIIGVGKIGSALLKRLISTNTIDKNKIIIFDVDKEKLHNLSKDLDVDCANSNTDLVNSSKHVLIAVIPQVMDIVLREIETAISMQHVIVSIAAGVSFTHITKIITKPVSLIRIMTNIPALVGAAATAIARNENVKEYQLEFVKKIFNSVGMVVELEERHLDAVTGLSGSGPAYIFIIIEALADGGVKMGLPRDIALKLAAQTALGSAKLLLETNMHPAALKDMVATPGGTTITAIHELESAKIRATLIGAVEAATIKSKSLNSAKTNSVR
ncbi:MAG TPA: pyrroline-5-carboxylate reductase [Candidatus Nanopelagicaceae bacterium]|nr:pyrroline-5-carboxylate reductase [Candidatus Nanopelagicaceae bacterium]